MKYVYRRRGKHSKRRGFSLDTLANIGLGISFLFFILCVSVAIFDIRLPGASQNTDTEETAELPEPTSDAFYCYNIAYCVSDECNGIDDYTNSFSANIDTVAKVDSQGGWRELSTDEKMEVLAAVVRVECRYLGMRDSAPALQLKTLGEDIAGHYEPDTDVVAISYDYFLEAEDYGYPIVRVVCHEIYHRYQYYQVNLLNALKDNCETEKYGNLIMLDTIKTYEEEFENYITPLAEEPSSYSLYAEQEIEESAREYAAVAVQDYYNRLQNYWASH